MPVKVSGTWRDTKAWWVKVSGTWREGSSIFVKVAGVWREETFAPPPDPLTAVVSPTSVSAFGSGPVETTNSTTCTPAGGVTPYAFEWVKVSGQTMNLSSPVGATTNFALSFSASAVYRCKVTDDATTVAFSNNVSISITIEEE